MKGSISLDNVRTGSEYDLISIYQDADDDITDTDSPFNLCNFGSDYYETNQFTDLIQSNYSERKHDSTSYFHLNCRGLSSNWDSFKQLIFDTTCDTFMFDYIGISECFKTHDDPRLRLPGYQPLISRSRENSPRGGVGLFIRDEVNFKIRDDLSVFIPHVIETVFIEIINKSSKNHILGVIYRPNTEPLADLDIFNENISDILNIIDRENKPGVIMGDMNIDLLKYANHEKTNTYLDNIFSTGFIPVIVKPTRLSHTSATLIDHIYVNHILNIGKSGILINDVADHFGTFYIQKHRSLSRESPNEKKRLITGQRIETFIDKLGNTDFSQISNLLSADQSYDLFISKYLACFNETFPLVKVHTSKNIKREPWCTPEFIQSSKMKSQLHCKKLSKPTEHNITKYKEHNKVHKKLQRRLKVEYYRNAINENKGNIKRTWDILKQAIGKFKDKSGIHKNIQINGINESDKHVIAEGFNEFFSNIGKQTSKNVPRANRNYMSYMPTPTLNSIFIEPVTEEHVLQAATKLKPKTSCGYDQISSKLLKETLPVIIKPLTHIINLSLDTGIVPKSMKTARVIPIFKSGDPSVMKNHRPISILPAMSKILERIMYDKIVCFFNTKNLFYQHQYGFRQKHSTIHPIIHLLNHCAQSNNKPTSEKTLAIFCDLSKAFDVIRHDILLKKLETYGIRGVANDWFKSYLTDRKQYVDVNGHESTLLNIDYGVPQGSILGPLMYLIYVNDIYNSCEGNIMSFADDTTLFVSHSNLDQLYRTANEHINKLYEWFCSNGLSLNAGKTKFIIIRSKHARDNLTDRSIHIGNTKLTRIGNDCDETSTKFLGLLIDENLTWRDHISHVNKKISRTLFSLKQVKQFLPTDCMNTLYFSLVQSHLSYGILAWGNASQSVLRQTCMLQKRAIRIVNNSKYNSHTDPLFRSSAILKLSDLHELHMLLFMYDFKNNKLPISFEYMFQTNESLPNSRHTRQSELYHIPRYKSDFCRRLPCHVLPNAWNHWSRDINHITSRSQLKSKLKIFLLNRYQQTVVCNNTGCIECHGNI